jgi:putative ABC transport system ATP-binding protein
MIKLLRSINRERGDTIVAATHDLKIIEVSDSIVFMRDGKVERVERSG